MLSHSLGTYLCLYTARGNTHSGLNILLVPQFTMYHYLRLCLVRFGIAVLESVLTLCMVLLPLPPMIAAPLGVSTISLFLYYYYPALAWHGRRRCTWCTPGFQNPDKYITFLRPPSASDVFHVIHRRQSLLRHQPTVSSVRALTLRCRHLSRRRGSPPPRRPRATPRLRVAVNGGPL